MQAIEITQDNWRKGVVVPGFPVPPINGFLGGELISHDPANGVVRVSFPTKPEHANPAGFVMGGITAAFLDHIPGPLMVAATGGTAFPITLDIHVTYFKPVPIGPRAIAEARIDRMTKSTIFTTSCILGENDEVLVRSIQTGMLKPVGG
jgi:uncharacterized protein (TIGR00369 family)